MAHVSQTYTHTLQSTPTVITPYQHTRNANDAGYGANIAMPVCAKQLSEFLYADLRSFLSEINDFPFSTEFEVASGDVTYATSTLVPYFKIGTMQYVISMSCMAAGTNYIPWVYVDPKDSNLHKSTSLSLRNDSKSESKGFRTLNNTLVAGSTNTYKYTLHLYYNTDFIILGFTTDSNDEICCILTQVLCKDRRGNDWYLVTSCLGSQYYTTGLGPNTALVEFHSKDNPRFLPISKESSICQWTDTDAYAPVYGSFVYEASGSKYALTSQYSTIPATIDQAPLFFNPCARVKNIGNASKIINNGISDLYADTADASDVIIAYPIILNGLLSGTPQMLCASSNIILGEEYVFGGKKYFCPVDIEFSSFAMPFLFEFDIAE